MREIDGGLTVKNTETSGENKMEKAAGTQPETAASADGQKPEAAPKRKKFSAVFRPQNAQSIRMKPGAASAKKKPAEQQAAGEAKAKAPAARSAEKPAEVKPKPQPQQKEAVAAPVKETAAVPAKSEAPEKKPAVPQRQESPAKAAPAAAEAEVKSRTAEPEAGKAAAKAPVKAPAAKTAEPKEPVQKTAGEAAKKSPDAKTSAPSNATPRSAMNTADKIAATLRRVEAARNAAAGIAPGTATGPRVRPGTLAPGAGRTGQRSGGPGGFGQRSGGAGGQGGGFGQRSGGAGGFGQRSAGAPGGRGAQGGGFGGGKDDSSLVKKSASKRPDKNNFKDKNDKRHRTEDGFKTARGGKTSLHPFIMPERPKVDKTEEQIREITVPEKITLSDLAKLMKKTASELIKKLFLKGEVYNMNSEIPYEKAEELALDYDILCSPEEKVDVIEELLKEDTENPEDMVPRPPVVCVMGHVDHGKTSLLDAIRDTSVTSREAGGITQHIGAYQVKVDDRYITFLDTPGHEAFTAMRMRGAQAPDIAVLVVAADDGVMPQTVEAINHAKAAGVDIIVAINKIDRPNANPEKVKQELMKYDLVSEDWGGSTIMCPISAKTHEGIENLLEMILLTADVKELKANPNRNARGLVIEAQLDKGRGPVATVLVQKGTLHIGDYVAAGSCSGKVRAMLNEKGMRLKEARPSTPVAILGLNNVPNAGEVFVAMNSDKEAKDFAATFISEGKSKLVEETKARMSLDDLFGQIKAGNVKELPIIVKADVQGSVEAVKQSLAKLTNEEVQVKVIHAAAGQINESDVSLASASGAIIIGFNVRPDSTAKATAEQEKVDIRLYSVIYQAIEDIENAMKGMLAPVYEERIIGHAEIRMLFKASGVGTIAGSYVLDGKIQRGCKARITREGKQIFDGALASLKRFKDDVKEVNAGYECGLVFEKFNDLMEGDQVELYAMVEVPRQ